MTPSTVRPCRIWNGSLLYSFRVRAYRCHARSAPAAARRAMLRMADEELAHARTLLTAHYLMTGKFYQPYYA